MSRFTSAVRTFIKNEQGVTALEYGMISALIAAVIIFAVQVLGTKVLDAFVAVDSGW